MRTSQRFLLSLLLLQALLGSVAGTEDSLSCKLAVAVLEEKSPYESKRAYAFKQYSGKDMNDLGNYDACNRVPKMHYSLLVASISKPHINFYMGLCLPVSCDEEALDFARDYIK